ncbi:hypothetical protein EDB92DRAFT_1817575 [Lactarius akahatsu]|uniref:Uncharacterized protein n=1 Tax=Lactarius akahatsu TaxID=416441 RepID=A0AAD4LG99_9AGAM|nr:hypothetical protein EDB92DRAFT_1817575 [Lactarius akahatsu]
MSRGPQTTRLLIKYVPKFPGTRDLRCPKSTNIENKETEYHPAMAGVHQRLSSATDYASRHLNVGCQLNDAGWKKKSTGTKQGITIVNLSACVAMECRCQRGCARGRRDGGGRGGVVLNPGATAHSASNERVFGLVVRIVRNVEIVRGVNESATEVLPVQLGWDGMSFQGGKSVVRSGEVQRAQKHWSAKNSLAGKASFYCALGSARMEIEA